MTSSEAFDEALIQASQNEFATKIIDGIEKLYGSYSHAAKRWIWELV
jgi:hypothetical protein